MARCACGFEISNLNDKFCSSCGNPINKNNATSATNISAGQSAAPAQKAKPAHAKTRVSWLSEILLIGKAPSDDSKGVCTGTLSWEGIPSFKTVHILAKSTVGFGKSDDPTRGNDVILYSRASGPNDSKTHQDLTDFISGKHFEIHLDNIGLRVKDLSTNGTALNGVKLPKEEPVSIPLDRISRLDVVFNENFKGESFKLQLTPVLVSDDNLKEDPYSKIQQPAETFPLARKHGIRALLIERLANYPESECYLMLFDYIALGGLITKLVGDSNTEGDSIRLVARKNSVLVHNMGYSDEFEVNKKKVPVGSSAVLEHQCAISIAGNIGKFGPIKQVD